MVYILVGFNTTFQEDMYRLEVIRGYGCDAFVMLYDKTEDRLLREFSHWANRFYFRNRSFEDFLKSRNCLSLLSDEVNKKKEVPTFYATLHPSLRGNNE